MTSGTILPSIGPPPPEFRRSFVPEHLRPKPLGPAAQEQPARTPPVRPQQIDVSDQQKNESQGDPPPESARQNQGQNSGQNTGLALVNASAVAVQVQEGSVEPPAELPPPPKREPLANELTDEERTEVKRLKERDREVRAHEAAHASVGRGFTGTPSYEFATGPDGVRYAVGGHVDIDVAEVPDDPEATIAKMEVVRAAALAPSRPSGQDRAVAAAAAAKAREAQAELAKEAKDEALGLDEGSSSNTSAANSVSGISNPQANTNISPVAGVQASNSQPGVPQAISINLVV